jgi:arylsulfatase A-like enzyme/lipopolysaccharide biosynthesis regulator YciM
MLLALAALCLAAQSGCGPPDETSPGAPLVLISIDTLRSDRLPVYGYSGVATPAIDRLRADGILYRHAYSPAPLTLPAHASLLTGTLPPVHGVRDNIGYSLSETLPTLAERLGALGYRTGAAVSAFVLRSETGIDRGFEHFDDDLSWSGFAVMGDVQRSGLETLAAIDAWLTEVAGEPFFLFLHIYEPHSPYLPPEPFASRYPRAYDGEIAAADQAVGALTARLVELGVYDQAAILLTADHGEGLGEHGEAEHGVLLYRESLQVPMILKLPRSARAGAEVGTAVQLSDVPTTLLSLVGAEVPRTMSGHSLLSLPEGEAPQRAIYSETYYPRLRLGWSELRSLIEGPIHYIEGPSPELYDLSADSAELVNLQPRERRLAAALRRRLSELEAPLAEPNQGSAEELAALSSLGYLGERAVAENPAELPDPKARVHTLETLDRGLARFRAGEVAEATEDLERAVRENPGVVVAWEFLGRAYLHTGESERAYEALSRGYQLANGAPHLNEHLARAALATGRLEEASEFLRLALERDPDRAALQLVHGRVLLELGRLDEALEVAERVRTAQPRNADAAYLTGTTRMGLGRLPQAEADLRHALSLSATHTGAMSDLAVLLLSTDRPAEARPVLERLLELQPGNEHARRLLGGLPARTVRE